jgi:hypothetical protein
MGVCMSLCVRIGLVWVCSPPTPNLPPAHFRQSAQICGWPCSPPTLTISLILTLVICESAWLTMSPTYMSAHEVSVSEVVVVSPANKLKPNQSAHKDSCERPSAQAYERQSDWWWKTISYSLGSFLAMFDLLVRFWSVWWSLTLTLVICESAWLTMSPTYMSAHEVSVSKVVVVWAANKFKPNKRTHKGSCKRPSAQTYERQSDWWWKYCQPSQFENHERKSQRSPNRSKAYQQIEHHYNICNLVGFCTFQSREHSFHWFDVNTTS